MDTESVTEIASSGAQGPPSYDAVDTGKHLDHSSNASAALSDKETGPTNAVEETSAGKLVSQSKSKVS